MRTATQAGLLLVCALAIGSDPAYGDHPTASFGAGGGPINTIGAATLEQGSQAASLRVDYQKFERYSDAQLLALADQGHEPDSTDFAMGAFFSYAYGWSDDVTIVVRLPYFYLDDIREPEDGVVVNEGNSSGIGDLLGLVFWRFYHSEEDKIHLTLIAGLETPTGRTHAMTSTGERFEVDHQPGSGSWDPTCGLALSKYWDRLSFHTNVYCVFTTEGSQDTELGNLFSYNAALVWRLNDRHDHHEHDHHDGTDEDGRGHVHAASYHPGEQHGEGRAGQSQNSERGEGLCMGCCGREWPIVDLMLELNGLTEGELRVRDVPDNDNGGTILFVTPGVRLTFGDHWSCFFAGSIPIARNPNGANQEIDFRLTGGGGLSW